MIKNFLYNAIELRRNFALEISRKLLVTGHSRRPNLAWTDRESFSIDFDFEKNSGSQPPFLKQWSFLLDDKIPIKKWRFLKLTYSNKKRWLSNHPGSTHDHAIIAPLKLVQLERSDVVFLAKLGISSQI